MAKKFGWYVINFIKSICRVLFLLFNVGQGQYALTDEFSSISIPADEINLISTVSIDEIVKNVKEGIR